MKVSFKDKKVAKIFELDASILKFPIEVIQSANTKVKAIKKAKDLQTIRMWKSWHVEKLKGSRAGLYSLRLNNQWRLLFRQTTINSEVSIEIVSVEDYH